MTGEGPARLTSALLVKKGNAAPAAYGLPAQSIASLVQDAQQGRKMFAAFTSVQDTPGRLVEVSESSPKPAPVRRAPPRRKPVRRDSRARLSLRVDPDKYLRLKLVSAHRRISLQQVLTDAIDYYLEDIAPSVCERGCACLESGRIDELPRGGCKRS